MGRHGPAQVASQHLPAVAAIHSTLPLWLFCVSSVIHKASLRPQLHLLDQWIFIICFKNSSRLARGELPPFSCVFLYLLLAALFIIIPTTSDDGCPRPIPSNSRYALPTNHILAISIKVMPAKSLVDLASAVCIKNLKGLESIGDYLPYASVRHILLKVDSAYQLRRIELNSPQLQGETGEIWLRIIERDFPLEYKSKGYKPQNASKWYRVWEKYKADHDQALQESEEKLRSAFAGLKENKEKNTSKIVERKYLPRHGRVAVRRGLGPREGNTSVMSFGGGSRTKTINGTSIMRKVRREVKEIRNIHGSLSKAIRAPTRPAQLRSAPVAMINEKRIAAQPQYRPPVRETDPAAASAVEEHEQRAAFISDSEEDEGDSHHRSALKSPQQPTRRPEQRKMGGSAFARKFGGGPSSSSSQVLKSPAKRPQPPQAASPPPKHDEPSRGHAEAKTAAKVGQYLPRPQTSPPPADPPSPPAASSAAAAPTQPVRKRKAVDVFMRPKKRF